MTGLAELLAQCDAKGVQLTHDGDGGLTVSAAKEAMLPGLMEKLRKHKLAILDELAERQWKETIRELNWIIGARIVPEHEWPEYHRLADAAGDAKNTGEWSDLQRHLDAMLEWGRRLAGQTSSTGT